MHIRISSFYEYHDLAHKILKIGSFSTKNCIFMFSRAARQQKVPKAQV